MSLIEKLAEDIAAAGVRRVFGITGSGPTLSLLDALDQREIVFHNCQFEGAAAIMAGVTGRLSGRAGVALSIKGPGLANMVPGLAAATFEGWPLVAIAEAYGPRAGPAKAHKRIDQGALVSAVAKGRRQLAAGTVGFADMAAWAQAESPAPTVLELAGDDVDVQSAVPTVLPGIEAPHAALSLIEKAERPMVIIGAAAERLGWTKFAEIAVPIFTTVAAKGAIDERMPNAAGIFTGVGLERTPERALLSQVDLVVGFGLRTNELLGAAFPVPVVNVDPLGCLASPGILISAFTSDAPAVLQALASKPVWGIAAIDEARTRLRQALLAHGFQPPLAFETIQTAIGRRARAVLDTGYFCTVGEHAWIADDSRLFLGSPQGRYMGIALPTGIAAATEDPGVPTIVIVGDGGIGMFLGELRLAVELRLPLLLVLMSDGGYGSVRTRAIAEGLIQSPMLKRTPSWRAVIDAFGCSTSAVSDENSLADAVAAWCPDQGPAYIEINFEPDAYQAMVAGVR